MARPQLVARVETLDDGTVRVLSPAVGAWTDPPAPDARVGPGSAVGGIERLHRRFRLVLPDEVSGVVLGGRRSRRIAVEHGEELFRLAPLGAADRPPAAAAATLAGLPEGARAVAAPTDGVYYRRPAPDAEPFVEVGSIVERGQPVGLIEVMKTFNQILFDGDDLPERGEVLEVRCDDATEVEAGQLLVVVRRTR